MKTLIIDADTIAYISVLNNQQIRELNDECEYDKEYILEHGIEIDTNLYQFVNLPEAFKSFEYKLNKILEISCISNFKLIFGIGKNFRYFLFNDYKANRKDLGVTIVGIDKLKRYIKDKIDNVEIVHTIEADDYVAYLVKKDINNVLCAMDKDLLNSIEGTHFNYYEGVNSNMKWVTTKDILKWNYIQAIVGDTSDNIKGIYNMGPKKTEKLFEGKDTIDEIRATYFKAYENKRLDIQEAIMNLNLVNINTVCDKSKNKEEHFEIYYNGVKHILYYEENAIPELPHLVYNTLNME